MLFKVIFDHLPMQLSIKHKELSNNWLTSRSPLTPPYPAQRAIPSNNIIFIKESYDARETIWLQINVLTVITQAWSCSVCDKV